MVRYLRSIEFTSSRQFERKFCQLIRLTSTLLRAPYTFNLLDTFFSCSFIYIGFNKCSINYIRIQLNALYFEPALCLATLLQLWLNRFFQHHSIGIRCMNASLLWMTQKRERSARHEPNEKKYVGRMMEHGGKSHWLK